LGLVFEPYRSLSLECDLAREAEESGGGTEQTSD
jgi:hypothetical protein